MALTVVALIILIVFLSVGAIEIIKTRDDSRYPLVLAVLLLWNTIILALVGVVIHLITFQLA